MPIRNRRGLESGRGQIQDDISKGTLQDWPDDESFPQAAADLLAEGRATHAVPRQKLMEFILSRCGSDYVDQLLAVFAREGIRVVDRIPETRLQGSGSKCSGAMATAPKNPPRGSSETRISSMPAVPLNLSPEDAAYYWLFTSQTIGFPRLGQVDERALVIAMNQGDLQARERLVLANLHLVIRQALRYSGNGLPLADLVQAGNLGLIRAVDQFDCAHSYRLPAYAIGVIRHEMQHALIHEVGFFSHPARLDRGLGKVGTRRDAREQKHGQVLEVLDLSAKPLLLHKRGAHYLERVASPLSLDDPTTNTDTWTIRDTLLDQRKSPDEEVLHTYFMQELKRALASQPLRERQIIVYRKGLDGESEHSLEEVGHILNLTRERVRQIESRALATLQKQIASDDHIDLSSVSKNSASRHHRRHVGKQHR